MTAPKSTAARITTSGRAWHDPVGGMTAWQREVRDGPRRPEHRIGSLPIALAVMLLILAVVWMIAKGWHF